MNRLRVKTIKGVNLKVNNNKLIIQYVQASDNLYFYIYQRKTVETQVCLGFYFCTVLFRESTSVFTIRELATKLLIIICYINTKYCTKSCFSESQKEVFRVRPLLAFVNNLRWPNMQGERLKNRVERAQKICFPWR